MPMHPRASLELLILERIPQLHKSLPGKHKPHEGHSLQQFFAEQTIDHHNLF